MIIRFVCSFEAYIRLKLIFVGMIKCVWYFGGERCICLMSYAYCLVGILTKCSSSSTGYLAEGELMRSADTHKSVDKCLPYAS